MLDLPDGERYRLQESVTSPITGSGIMLGNPEPSVTESRGRWFVQVIGPQELLKLEGDDGSETVYRIASGGSGSVEIDGETRQWTSR